MSFSCSQCDFTTNFKSALMMHRQLHHEEPTRDYELKVFSQHELKKTATLPVMSRTFLDLKGNKELKPPARTSSATRLFDRLRARICRGRTLFSHPEDPAEDSNDLCMLSECTSKAFKDDLPLSGVRSEIVGRPPPPRETFGCHLCGFEADRITALDRHLLNDHKIGIDNLLKLVMAKTKDGLSEDTSHDLFRRKPYYKPQDLEEGEFIIETEPKIKILKHAATNTENIGLSDNFKMITSELEKIANCPIEACDKKELYVKMQTLNECMCKFVDSSNMLKKVLNKEFDSKSRSDRAEPVFDLRLGDSTRDW